MTETAHRRRKTSHPDMIQYPNDTFYYKRGPREVSLRTKNEAEALKRLRLVRKQYDELGSLNTRIKIKELRDTYLAERKADLKSGKIRVGTIRETEYILDQKIMPYFGNMSPARADSLEWGRFIKKTNYSNYSNIKKVMAHFMKWCVVNKFANGIPIYQIPSPKRRPRRILKPNEIRLIYQNADGSLKLFISMALFMGMRRTEIMTMKWANISSGFMKIEAQFTKTKRSREIPINQEVMRLLSERQAAGNLSRWLFPNANDPKRHAHPDGLKGSWHRCLRRAYSLKKYDPKPDVTWHDLRATCEAFAHKRTDLSATQLEKYFGANIDVQRRIYANLDRDDLLGVENTISIKGLEHGGRTVGDDSKIVDVDISKGTKSNEK